MDHFLSFCIDAGIESEKTLVQIKETWRSLFDKFKAAKDHNNKTGRDRKTFEFYDDNDEFLSGSDKVDPKFVKETRVKPNVSRTNSDSGNSDELTAAAADPTTVADMRYRCSKYCQVKSWPWVIICNVTGGLNLTGNPNRSHPKAITHRVTSGRRRV